MPVHEFQREMDASAAAKSHEVSVPQKKKKIS